MPLTATMVITTVRAGLRAVRVRAASQRACSFSRLRMPAFTSAFTAVATLALIACGDRARSAETTASANTSSHDPSKPMKYAKIDVANHLGFAKVSVGTGENYAEGVIDAHGAEIIPPSTEFLVNDITDAVALLQFAAKFLFVDLDQGPVDTTLFATTNGFTFAEPFRSGLALVTVGDDRFFIDANGERPLKETYEFAESFHHDRSLVYNGGKKRIIDPKGRTVARLSYDQVSPYNAIRWQVTRIKEGVYLTGLVDLDGKEVVPIIYDAFGYFQEDVNRTIVGIKGVLGYLDEVGNLAIPLQFDYAESFVKGKARVRRNGRDYFIDPNGKEVLD